ncbi:MAG: hypothetical protein KKH01_05120 [Firmicutes bacterium]|nr:hypothetical protein [Bacillota bacterium]
MNKKLLEEIQKTAFQFFQDFTNFNEESTGYGLTVDHTNNLDSASIASSGFMLSSLIIGVQHGYISHAVALHQARKTLFTLYHHAEQQYGFYAHFFDINTGQRRGKCEYSTIDTALALCGVLAVDAYFNDEEISKLSQMIVDRVDWQEFIFEKDGKKFLHMSYNPNKDGAYALGKAGFIYQWDMFAEQLMMYVMIGGGKYQDQANDLYQGFARDFRRYGEYEYFISPGNTLFNYQFPLAFLNLEGYRDTQNISWFDNAKIATLAHLQCSLDYQKTYKTFSKAFFGFNASDTPLGYRVFSALPNSLNELKTDGTVAPFSMIGSLPFTPDISMASIEKMLKINGLWGRYGFYDAFNLEKDEPWISQRYIAIDKGLEMLMCNFVLTKDVQNALMNHPVIVKGLETLHWVKK